jgi:hypothetical protein
MQTTLFDGQTPDEPPRGGATGELVPFGKLKDQPLEALLAHADYAVWLLNSKSAQLRKSHPAFLTWLVKNFGAPETTPEHNRLQNRFLKRDFCNQFVLHLFPHMLDEARAATSVKTLSDAWRWQAGKDIALYYSDYFLPSTYDFSGPASESHVKHKQKVRDGLRDSLRSLQVETTRTDATAHGVLTNWAPVLHIAPAKFEVDGADALLHTRSSYWVGVPDVIGATLVGFRFERTLRVEVKPFVGDDYPVVLRAMVARNCNVLLLERFEADGASWEEMVQVFASRQIRVAALDDVLLTEVPGSVNQLPIPSIDTPALEQLADQELERFDEQWLQKRRKSAEESAELRRHLMARL